MKQEIYVLRAKKIGVMLKQIRESQDQTESNCANWLGIKIDDYRSLENGTRCISLSQIESISSFFGLPFEVFTSASQEQLNSNLLKSDVNQGLITLRDKMIAVQLKQKREELGISVEQLANDASISSEDIFHYEDGIKPIPYCHLQSLLEILEIPLDALTSRQGSHKPASSIEYVPDSVLPGNLSEEMAAFVSKPANLPYLELAMRISKMDANKIRGIASSLLEITY
jgi:transcriptional regulator with XRE-family HTH domain